MSDDVQAIQWNITRGQFSGGDPTQLEDGFARKIRNMLPSTGVWEKRPQFTYDNLTGIHGLALWEDDANKVTRLISVDTSGNLKAKGTSGETWGSAATGTISGTRLTSFDSYRGKGYGMLDNGSGLPSGAFSYDGTAISTTPFNSSIFARCALFYKERLFLIYPRVSVTNLLTAWQAAYTASGGRWNLANVDAREVTAGSVTIGEIIPTATTGAYIYTSAGTVLNLTSAAYRVWSCDLQNPNPSYEMPMTLRIQLTNPWTGSEGYLLDEIVTPSASNDYRYRAIVAGTSAGVEPTWPTTIGSTVVDNTVTWLCDGKSILGEQEINVPTASEAPGFTRYWVEAKLPPTPGEYTVRPYMVFGNTATPTITLSSINIGYRDGLADGNINKKNYGQQVTAGDYFYPFFNQEALTAVLVDLDEIQYSEIGEPNKIRAQDTYNMGGTAGLPTAAIILGGRLIVFKRRSIWKFAAVEDANVVILPEGDEMKGVGCLGPRAVDVFEDTAYFIAEDSVYAWRYGEEPVDICGEGMRAEIMNKASTAWVEAQTYNMPLCHVDKKNQVLYVYTQKGKLYAYSIRYKAWSFVESGGDTTVSPVGYEIRALHYHPGTGNMYVSFGTAGAGTAGIARLDASVAVAADSISTSGTSTVHAEVWYRPIEMTGPRYEILLDNVQVYHKATASQTGQTTTAYVSMDHGITFPKSNQVVLSPVSTGAYTPMRIDLYQSYGSLLLRLLHSGNGGASNFSVSRTEAEIQVLSGDYPKALPTAGSATL